MEFQRQRPGGRARNLPALPAAPNLDFGGVCVCLCACERGRERRFVFLRSDDLGFPFLCGCVLTVTREPRLPGGGLFRFGLLSFTAGIMAQSKALEQS